MRFRITLAVCLSLLLIVMAVWYRPQKLTTIIEGGFVEQNTTEENNNYEEELLSYLRTISTSTPASKVTNEELNTTDLVGRQLFLDFLNMSSRGEATDENITSLANLYAENLASLSDYTAMNLLDLVLAPMTKENLEKYGERISAIYFKYEKLLEEEVARGDSIDFSSLNSFSKGFALSLSEIYFKEAEELKKIPVPQGLAQTHLDLINNYLARASSYKAISEADKDPALAFAALASQDKNTKEEDDLHWQILDALLSYGI